MAPAMSVFSGSQGTPRTPKRARPLSREGSRTPRGFMVLPQQPAPVADQITKFFKPAPTETEEADALSESTTDTLPKAPDLARSQPGSSADSIPAGQQEVVETEAAAAPVAGTSAPALDLGACLVGGQEGEATTGVLEQAVGARLTEENVEKFEASMTKVFQQHHGAAKQDEGDELGKRGKVRWMLLQSIVKTGKFPSSSNSMYNLYRKEHPSAEIDKMEKEKALAHRLEWANGKFEALDTQRSHMTSWKNTR